MFTSINVKGSKKCAFCVHWYDPANSHIRPKSPVINVWEYETNARSKCLKRGTDTSAVAFCPNYQCKVPLR